MNIPELGTKTLQHNIFHERRAYKVLFKCSHCRMIVSAEFDDEDLEDVRDEKVTLECPCGEQAHVLFD